MLMSRKIELITSVKIVLTFDTEPSTKEITINSGDVVIAKYILDSKEEVIIGKVLNIELQSTDCTFKVDNLVGNIMPYSLAIDGSEKYSSKLSTIKLDELLDIELYTDPITT